MTRGGNEICWVYVVEADGRSFSIGILVALLMQINELELRSVGGGKGKLIYCKQFPDTLSALGQKLLLEQLSRFSLMRVIKKENPGLIDLRNIFNN